MKRLTKHSTFWLTILAVVLLRPEAGNSTNTQTGASNFTPCTGTWVGSGRNGTDPPWSIQMTITALQGPACGRIEYPSLGCGGMLTNCTSRSGQTTFIEVYDHNNGRCAPDGTVVARCTGNQMHWVWVGEDTVETTLTRR